MNKYGWTGPAGRTERKAKVRVEVEVGVGVGVKERNEKGKRERETRCPQKKALKLTEFKPSMKKKVSEVSAEV